MLKSKWVQECDFMNIKLNHGINKAFDKNDIGTEDLALGQG